MSMVGNPVLGFLAPPPNVAGAYGMVAKVLRILGIVVLVGAALNVLQTLLTFTGASFYYASGPYAAAAGATAVIGLVFGLAIAAAVCFWITFTYVAWTKGERRASTHVLVMGILATVFGGFGVLGGLVGAGLSAAIFAVGASPVYMLLSVLGLLVSAAQLACGIALLVNRGPATAAAPPSAPAWT